MKEPESNEEFEDSFPILYEDDVYRVFHEMNRQQIMLSMETRGLSIDFTYHEWQQLRALVASFPEVAPRLKTGEQPTNSGELVSEEGLHAIRVEIPTDGPPLVVWHMLNRMFEVHWHIEGWYRFRDMMLTFQPP